MEIFIRKSSSLPIYEQIYTEIRDLIISGKLKEGDALPSIRALAKDLRISVITTKRAYDELEREGYIYTVAAKGCFVAANNLELARKLYFKELESHIQRIAELSDVLNIKKGEIIKMFTDRGITE